MLLMEVNQLFLMALSVCIKSQSNLGQNKLNPDIYTTCEYGFCYLWISSFCVCFHVTKYFPASKNDPYTHIKHLARVRVMDRGTTYADHYAIMKWRALFQNAISAIPENGLGMTIPSS